MLASILFVLATASSAGTRSPSLDVDLGIFQIEGAPPVDLTAVATKLLGSLSAARGITAANFTLGVTARTSFHMFATNRTEFCHYHPGDTTSTVIYGHGRFFSNSSAPVPQRRGSVYFVPRGTPHAFGHAGGAPTVVTVAWSPPFHDGYKIPTVGCVGLPPQRQPTKSPPAPLVMRAAPTV